MDGNRGGLGTMPDYSVGLRRARLRTDDRRRGGDFPVGEGGYDARFFGSPCPPSLRGSLGGYLAPARQQLQPDLGHGPIAGPQLLAARATSRQPRSLEDFRSAHRTRRTNQPHRRTGGHLGVREDPGEHREP